MRSFVTGVAVLLTLLGSSVALAGALESNNDRIEPATDTCSSQLIGDIDGDGWTYQLADLVYLIGFLQSSGPAPAEMSNADVNGDCFVNMLDAACISDAFCEKVTCTCMDPMPCVELMRGDVNHDEVIDDDDVEYLYDFIVSGGWPYSQPSILDPNGDCRVNIGDTKFLIDYIDYGGPAPVDCSCLSPSTTDCCFGMRGNIDYDPYDLIEISDLVALANYMTNCSDGEPCPPLLCEAEADVDGSGELDIADLVYLVDYMFDSGPTPAMCQ